jgi:uncharacterized protein YceK
LEKLMKNIVLAIFGACLLGGCSLITVKADIPPKFTVVETSNADGVKTYQVEIPK